MGERGSMYTSSASSSSKNSKISPSSSDAGAFDGEHTYYPTKELIAGFRKKFVQFKDTKIKYGHSLLFISSLVSRIECKKFVHILAAQSLRLKREAEGKRFEILVCTLQLFIPSLSKSLPLDSNRKPPPFLPQDLLELDRKLVSLAD